MCIKFTVHRLKLLHVSFSQKRLFLPHSNKDLVDKVRQTLKELGVRTEKSINDF